MRTSVDVHTFLIEREIPHEVFLTTGRLRSPERLAAVLGLPQSDVARVVVFDGDVGPVAAVLPARAEPDAEALGDAVGARTLTRASDPRASELTGYLAESIPPAGLPRSFTIAMDDSLERDAVLYVPGGEVRSVLKVRGTDLVRATGAIVASIAVPAEAAGAAARAPG